MKTNKNSHIEDKSEQENENSPRVRDPIAHMLRNPIKAQHWNWCRPVQAPCIQLQSL